MKIRQLLKIAAGSNPITRNANRWKWVIALDARVHGADATFTRDSVRIQKGAQVVAINRRHAIYAGTIAKSFDVFFSAVKPVEENGVSLVDYSTPRVHTLPDGLQFEFASFPEHPGIIDEYLQWRTPQPGERVFDLGANWGLSVYRFSKLVGPGGSVTCFEPDPINLEILKKNIERHDLQNVTVVAAAIGGADGSAEFSSEGTIGSQMISLLGREPAGTVVKVPVMSLKTAFEKFGVPDFCKMDIEGAEIEALESAIESISANKIHFALETRHMVDGEFTDKRVEDIFRRAGYESGTEDKYDLITYARPA